MSEQRDRFGLANGPLAHLIGFAHRLGGTLSRSPVAGIAIVYVLILVTFSVLSPQFATTGNLSIVIGQAAAVSIASFAMTMVILSGGIDLSVGAVLALSSVVVAVLLADGMPIGVAVLVALAAAATMGLINGTVTVRWRVQPFLVTLGMLSVARGAAELIADGRTVPILDQGFVGLFAGNVGGIPVPAIWALAALAVSHIVLKHTLFGRRLYAIGGSERAAVQAGVRVGQIKVGVCARRPLRRPG